MKEFKKTEDGLFVCEECGKVCKSKGGLGLHIVLSHNTQKEYYDKWLLENNEHLCKICKKETEFTGFKRYYKNCCSEQCTNIYRHKQITKANFKKYGVNSTRKLKSVQNKAKQTCKIKYGNENYNNPEKTKQTCLEKYGVIYIMQNKEIRKKAKQTCLKRYGVENPAQDKKIYEKGQKTGLRAKIYKDSKIYYRSSFELDFLDKYYDVYPEIQNAPSVKYKFNNKNRIYFPDFYIPSLNLIIEIKYSYYAKRDKLQIQAKRNAVIDNGYQFHIIIDKNYKKFNKLFFIS